MPSLAEIRARSRWSDILEGQPQHALIAITMVAGAMTMLNDSADAPRLLGLSAAGWAALSIWLALAHQILVAVVFRLQLHCDLMHRVFGAADMRIWGAIFMPLLAARPLTLLIAGWADTAPITGFRWPEIVFGALLVLAAIWAMHSVLVHFTIPRALGGDHFRQRYADMPMVEKGAFRYTSNAMYGMVFLGLWGIALLFGSWNALVAALFQQGYIWVHMYCTEAPDMRWIYGRGSS